MAYAKPHRHLAHLRSRQKLEAAMRAADVNGSELAGAVGINRQTISNLRRGAATRVRAETAMAVERALRVGHGELFDFDHRAEPVAS